MGRGAGVIEGEVAELLQNGAAELGVGVTKASCEVLAAYCDIVAEHGRRLGLTGAGDTRSVAKEHVLDSLALLRFVEPPASGALADVGSGAGFPGLALKIARPEVYVHLFEAKARKVGFLEHVISTFGLKRVRVTIGRAEEEVAKLGLAGAFEIVTCRAVGKLAEVVVEAGKLVGAGGLLVSWKGKKFGEAEMNGARPALTELGFGEVEVAGYSLPYGGGSRLLVMCRRDAYRREGSGDWA